MGFAATKDRTFAAYEKVSGWIARRPAPLRRAAYGIFGAALWTAYVLPGNLVRPTIKALARHADHPSPVRLFRGFVRKFIAGMDTTEQIRHGFGANVDGSLTIPDKERLDAYLAQGGIFLALPHLHATLAMTRCLAQSYDALAVVSLTRNEKRAAAQRALYSQVDGEVLDARNEEPAAVARQILKALKAGKIVVGTVDRIQTAPDAPIDRARDVVRVEAFGQPVGFGGWPTRFAAKAGAPLVPAVVAQHDRGISLVLGQGAIPEGDLQAATQAWVSELERLLKAHPEEWAFSLDKHWSRTLQAPSPD
jgi:KDO2-lipid IV(A) lauroyltransferase